MVTKEICILDAGKKTDTWKDAKGEGEGGGTEDREVIAPPIAKICHELH